MRVDELEPLLATLVGERVTAKRIAGNSISLWFAVPSDSGDARGIWFEPPWRIEGTAGVETSSYGFPYEQRGRGVEG